MRFDNQIKCNSAQDLIDEATTVLNEEEHDSRVITGLIRRIEAQITILTHCISHSPREDLFSMQNSINALVQNATLLQQREDAIDKI